MKSEVDTSGSSKPANHHDSLGSLHQPQRKSSANIQSSDARPEMDANPLPKGCDRLTWPKRTPRKPDPHADQRNPSIVVRLKGLSHFHLSFLSATVSFLVIPTSFLRRSQNYRFLFIATQALLSGSWQPCKSQPHGRGNKQRKTITSSTYKTLSHPCLLRL